MRTVPVLLKAVIALALLLPAGVAGAQSLRLVSADAGGVSLRLSLPDYRLSAPRPDGRVELGVAGFSVTNLPGRPLLPYAQTLLALPPGATVVARVVDAGEEELREGLHLVLGARPVMKEGNDGLGAMPALEPVPPILDGPWPAAPVELGDPATVRGQRLVAVQVRPFRYDEATGRLWVRRQITVRVDFTGAAPGAATGAAVTDRHWEPVLRSALANYDQGRLWREPLRPAGPPPAGGLFRDRAALPEAVRAVAGFDESQPEVRIKVDSTGVYAFPYTELAARGFPANVPVGEVSLHRHEYVGPADPPYVTIELPIEVDDANANGVFDGADAIVAFVPNWVERSGVTSMMQRSWGDAEVVYATRLAGGTGLRMPLRPGWRGAAGLTPLFSYPWTQRWERDFSYFAYPSPLDTAEVDRFLWTSYFTYYSRPDSFRFETNQLDVSHPVLFRTALQGTNNNIHIMFAQILNGTGQASMVVDSLTWGDKTPREVTVTLPGSAVTEGLTNSLRLWGKNAFAPPDPVSNALSNSGLNWFQATYWRSYRALQGYLDATSGDATGLYQVSAAGFTSSAIRVYDVSDITSPVRLVADSIRSSGGAFTLDFQDSTGATPRRYVLFDRPKTLPQNRYSAVTRRHLTAAGGERDYLLIAPEAFLSAAAPLATLRQSQGLDTLVAAIESVNDEFNGGRRSKYAIKRFLLWAAGPSRWNTRFVLLMGDGSADGRGTFSGAGTDWLPVALIPGPVSSGSLGLEMIPSDPWYGWCLNDDPGCWDAAVLEPDLYVGRLPVNSLQQAQDVVSKIVAYETFAADETWRRRMVLLADDCYSGVTTFGGGGAGNNGYCFRSYEIVFRQLNEAVQQVISSSAGMSLAGPELLDLRSYLTDPSLYQPNGFGDTCRVGNPTGESRAEAILRADFDPVLFRKLNDGVLWWNYQGHANPYVLSHEGFYRNQGSGYQDRENLLNEGRLFFFSAFSCHANAFSDVVEGNPALGPSLGENLVTLPQRGAIASWASTGFEIVPVSGTYHLNVELARSLFSNPPHDDELGRGVADRGARVVLGEAIALTLLNYLPTVRQSYVERGVGLTYNLLGDPATRLWVGPAQITVTANGQAVTSGEPVRLTTSSDTLRLEAELVSNVEIRSIELLQSGRSGTTAVPPELYRLTPAFPDTGATGQGGRRYHLSYVTTLATSSLRYTLRVTDRFGVTQLFDVVFEFQTGLFSDGVPVQEDDLVAPDAPLELLVLSPGKLDPDSLRLSVDGEPQPFTWEPARGDTAGRQYWLHWQHAPYADGRHTVLLVAPVDQDRVHHFRVATHFSLRDALAFPNPFDEELGTRFVFTLTGDAPADLLVRVYTVSGRRVYENRLDGLQPGHHEIPWDGLDEEGDKLANGIYFYKLVAHGPSGTSSYDGRLVKLRRPRRAADTAVGSSP